MRENFFSRFSIYRDQSPFRARFSVGINLAATRKVPSSTFLADWKAKIEIASGMAAAPRSKNMDVRKKTLFLTHENGRRLCSRPGDGRLVAGRLTPKPGNGQERSTVQCEAVFGFRIFRAGEFEERRGWHEAVFALSKTAPFGADVERAPSAARRKPKRHRGKLNGVAGCAHDRRRIVDADLVSLGKITPSSRNIRPRRYAAHIHCTSRAQRQELG